MEMRDKIKVILSEHKLDISDAIVWVSSPSCGAISAFIGTTRDTESSDDSRHVTHLHYEAYNVMALKMINQIVSEHFTAEIGKCFVSHRLGHVPIGDASILICASSAHRHAAHAMVMRVLNDVKAKVPIWKKVYFGSEDSHWSDKSDAFWI